MVQQASWRKSFTSLKTAGMKKKLRYKIERNYTLYFYDVSINMNKILLKIIFIEQHIMKNRIKWWLLI